MTIKVGDKPLIKCAYLLPFLFLPTIGSGFTNNLFGIYQQFVLGLPTICSGFTNNWFWGYQQLVRVPTSNWFGFNSILIKCWFGFATIFSQSWFGFEKKINGPMTSDVITRSDGRPFTLYNIPLYYAGHLYEWIRQARNATI